MLNIVYIFILFLFIVNNILLYGCTMFYLSIHQLNNNWIVSAFWLLKNAAKNICVQDFMWIYVLSSLCRKIA